MPEKYKNKFRIKSARLKGYDYSQNGLYFITICTKDREEYFGRIENSRMILSEIGKIIEKFWQEIPKHFTFTGLNIYQIMPNHIHGILEIMPKNIETPSVVKNVETPNLGVSTTTNWKSGCLGVIINQFKRICTIEIHKKQSNPVTFAWQSRFYDHIIRNEISLNKICEYIENNPQEWERDRNNLEENIWL